MNNLIFWIIVCSWLIPMGIRLYNRSRARRLQDRNFQDRSFPGQNYPGQNYPGPGSPAESSGTGLPAAELPGLSRGARHRPPCRCATAGRAAVERFFTYFPQQQRL
ncbi:hypothetical protein ACTAQJ_09085 [Arthrobacter sp. alpha11c]